MCGQDFSRVELSSDRTRDWLHLWANSKVSKHSLNLINGALLEGNWMYVQIRTCKHLFCVSVTWWIPASLHSRCVMWWGKCLTSADASACLKSRMLWTGTIQNIMSLLTGLYMQLAWSYSASSICKISITYVVLHVTVLYLLNGWTVGNAWCFSSSNFSIYCHFKLIFCHVLIDLIIFCSFYWLTEVDSTWSILI